MSAQLNSSPQLEDPVELALCRIWMNKALKDHLNDQPLEGSEENREYRDQYADGIVRSLWGFVQKEGLVAQDEPVVLLIEDCGWKVSLTGLQELFGIHAYRELANEYGLWRQRAGGAMHLKAVAAYDEGGQSALLALLYR